MMTVQKDDRGVYEPPRTQMVREFQVAMGLASGTTIGSTGRQRLIRAQMLLEEVAEWVEGTAARDLMNVLKELSDVDYVLEGAFVDFDLDLSAIPLPEFESQSDGPPQLILDYSTLLAFVSELTYEIGGLVSAMSGGNPTLVSVYLQALRKMSASLWTSHGVSEQLRYDLFVELHRSNMTKVGSDLSEAGRVVKGEHYVAMDVEKVLRAAGVSC